MDALYNILLAIASGAVSVGVFLLISINMKISKKLNEIDVKVSVMGVGFEYLKKDVERHEKSLSN